MTDSGVPDRARAPCALAYTVRDTPSPVQGEAGELEAVAERATRAGALGRERTTRDLPGMGARRLALLATLTQRSQVADDALKPWVGQGRWHPSWLNDGPRRDVTRGRRSQLAASRDARACSWRVMRRSRGVCGSFCSIARQLKVFTVVPRELVHFALGLGILPPTNTRRLVMTPASRSLRLARAIDSTF